MAENDKPCRRQASPDGLVSWIGFSQTENRFLKMK
jgi:hypothetical protein